MAFRADMPVSRAATAGMAVALVLWLVGATMLAAAPPDLQAATAAAEAAVREAFGPDIYVTLADTVLQWAPHAGAVVKAVAEPGSRTAGRVRFVLYGDGGDAPARIGRLTALVRVHADHVRTSGPVETRAVLSSDSVKTTRDDIGRQPFESLPSLDEVVGATTRKPLADGDVVTRAALVARPLVASGDEVVAIARVGALEVRGRAIAAQAGGLGDTVIVVNPDSRRRLHARVVGEAVVEVIHGS